MEYKEFVEYIKMNAGYIAGEGGNITINHVIKNNGCEMDGGDGFLGLLLWRRGKTSRQLYIWTAFMNCIRMVRILRT